MQTQTPGVVGVSTEMTFSEPAREQQKRDLAVEVLRASGQVRLAARGYSMLPSLWPGDVLTLQAATLDSLAAGDLVLFVGEGRFFVHRVLRRTQIEGQTRVVTRGDSMPREDQPVSADEVLGKVVSVERHGRILARVPASSLFVRGLGLALAWGRLRSVVLRLRQRNSVEGVGTASPDALPL